MLSRQNRLRKQKDFDLVFKDGRFFQNDFLAVKFRLNQQDFPRFAVVVSAKTAKSAVIRNRLRRQLNEIIRKEAREKLARLDVVLIIKPKLIGKRYQEIREIFWGLLKCAKLF